MNKQTKEVPALSSLPYGKRLQADDTRKLHHSCCPIPLDNTSYHQTDQYLSLSDVDAESFFVIVEQPEYNLVLGPFTADDAWKEYKHQSSLPDNATNNVHIQEGTEEV